MVLENVLVYQFASGDNTYPHSGIFTISVAGQVTIDDSDGSRDAEFGDFTHTGGADVPDQDVSASTVAGITVGDTIDVRYKYTITGSDGSSGTVYFVATNGASNYGPLMVSDFQLDPSVTYTFGTFNTDGAVSYDALVPCFTRGTQIETAAGEVPVERLRVGSLVRTLDDGLQPIRWIGSKPLGALDLVLQPKLRPICIARGSLGPDLPARDLTVSPQHRVLVRSRVAERMFGNDEVLLPAQKLLALDGVDVVRGGGGVEYFHFLFDRHQLVLSDGAITESLLPGDVAMQSIGAEARAEILALFPGLIGGMPCPARPVPTQGRRMRRLVERHAKNDLSVQVRVA